MEKRDIMKKTYIFLIALISALLIECNGNPADFFRMHVLYRDEPSPYFVIVGHPHHVLDYAGNKQEVNSYTIYMKTGEAEESGASITCEIYAVNYRGFADALYRKTDEPLAMPVSQVILAGENVPGNGFREIYGRFRYIVGEETTEYVFSEPILERTDAETALDDYGDEWPDDAFWVVVDYETEDDQYFFTITVELEGQERKHLDLQAWLATSDYGIYPFFGVYGFGGDRLEYPDLPADRGFGFSYLYIRAVLWQEEAKTEALYRIKLS